MTTPRTNPAHHSQTSQILDWLIVLVFALIAAVVLTKLEANRVDEKIRQIEQRLPPPL